MEDEEALKTSALVRQLSDAVQNQIHNLFADSVMAPGIIVGCIFLSSNQLLGMKKLTVCASTHLICGHISLCSNITTFKESNINVS
jgi:hypothetical protein